MTSSALQCLMAFMVVIMFGKTYDYGLARLDVVEYGTLKKNCPIVCFNAID